MSDAAPGVRKIRLRAAGCPDFEIQLDVATATVAEAKIEATAGCDIDPGAMRIIHRGKVLRDEDLLAACGVDGSQPLHVARGTAAAAAPPAAEGPAGGTAGLRVSLKGPGGAEFVIDALRAEDPVSRLRGLAAGRCGLPADEIHLVHKAKMLKDEDSLAGCGVSDGDVIRVARRMAQKPASQTLAAPVAAPAAAVGLGSDGAPMPMVWGGAPSGVMEQLRAAAATAGVPLEQLLGGMPLEVAEQALAAAQRRQGQTPAGESMAEMQARFQREARDMAQRVQLYLVQQAQEEGGAERPAGRTLDGRGEEAEDLELIADIARTLADCRSRGAPVPNAAVFVDRIVARRRQSRVTQARLDREASGMEPELEDALIAAERSAQAAARAPRRLGGGLQEQPPP